MAPRANWKGYLKLSLVSCPIAMYPASSERDKIRFHNINSETGNRVRMRGRRVNPYCAFSLQRNQALLAAPARARWNRSHAVTGTPAANRNLPVNRGLFFCPLTAANFLA